MTADFAASNEPEDRAGVEGLPPPLTTRVDKNPFKLFQVIEYSSFFAVRHLPSGAEVPMGDGVDALDSTGDEAFTPGTAGFVQEWTDALNANPQETLEAYFPELVHQDDEEDPA